MRWTAGLLFLAACTGQATMPPAQVSDDSPQLVIASPDTAGIAFDRIGAILPMPDTTVLISLPGSRQVLVYSRDGLLERVLGRPGSGPGEFASIGAAGLLADTLWVYDRVADRTTRFLPRTGDRVGTTRVGLRLPEWPGGGEVLALLADGSFLVQGRYSITGLLQRATPSVVPVARVTAAGRLLQAIGALDLTGWAFSVKVGGGEIQGVQPFRAVDRVAAALDGSRFALVSLGSDSVSVTMYDAAGGRLFERALPLVGDQLTAARADSGTKHLGGPFLTFTSGTIVRPERLPAVSQAIVGTDGSLWLELDPPVIGRSATRWAVLSPSGVQVDTVTMPTARQLVRPMAGAYWAVEVDSLDVPRASRYAFRGARTPPTAR